MTERPIIFSAPMVRALLAGTKTQTRRICKPRKDRNVGCELAPNELAGEINSGDYFNAPWQPGDRLWVRETHAIVPRTAYAGSADVHQVIRADDPYNHDAAVFREGWTRSRPGRWRPSIHMFRWASRITLEVTRVRVERLHACNEVDAIAEGAPWAACGAAQEGSHKAGFAQLWESINGPGSWDSNPWVWVVEFQRIDP